jgi:RNA polymerase sigma-70 factor, ECF subfamily
VENGRIPIKNDLWQSYRSTLYKFILRRVNDADTAEDIVQEVLIKAYNKQETLQNDLKIIPWLYQIARNVIVDHYRQNQQNDLLSENQIAADIQFNHEFESGLASCMQPLVEKLPDTFRQAIMLAEFDDFTQKEVAVRLNISLSGAKSRIQRGRKLLKRMLLDCCRVEVDRRGKIVEYQQNDSCDRC